MSQENDNTQDIIDSRDVIARIEELEEDEEKTDDEKEELKVLKELAKEGEDSADWPYGETLIRDTYFNEYAEQLAEDIGAIDSNAKWPLNHIDWDAAADELQSDYMTVDFDGREYYIRA